MTVLQAIKRIFAFEPDAIVSVKHKGKIIAILSYEDKMSTQIKEQLSAMECPILLKRIDIPPIIKSIIIDMDGAGGDSDAES